MPPFGFDGGICLLKNQKKGAKRHGKTNDKCAGAFLTARHQLAKAYELVKTLLSTRIGTRILIPADVLARLVINWQMTDIKNLMERRYEMADNMQELGDMRIWMLCTGNKRRCSRAGAINRSGASEQMKMAKLMGYWR